VLTVAQRWSKSSDGVWGDTVLRLPSGKWRDRLTDKTYESSGQESVILVDELLGAFPVALVTFEP
jgi:maltooligosyltrehalose synthase